MLTPAQLLTLRTDILARSGTDLAAFAPFDGTGDNPGIALWYNTLVTPPVLVWRPEVGVDELKNGVVWADYVALTPNGTLKQAAYLALTQGLLLDLTKQSIRDALSFIFGAGSATFATLSTTLRVPCTAFQNLFAGAVVQGAKVSTMYGQFLDAASVQQALVP